MTDKKKVIKKKVPKKITLSYRPDPDNPMLPVLVTRSEFMELHQSMNTSKYGAAEIFESLMNKSRELTVARELRNRYKVLNSNEAIKLVSGCKSLEFEDVVENGWSTDGVYAVDRLKLKEKGIENI